ncbi:hypothetical protein PERCYII40_0293 [Pseudomonas aeruginosa]|nr:hypothetical protein PERCYII40_0293 [Pseudomonas aeruginosa]
MHTIPEHQCPSADHTPTETDGLVAYLLSPLYPQSNPAHPCEIPRMRGISSAFPQAISLALFPWQDLEPKAMPIRSGNQGYFKGHS